MATMATDQDAHDDPVEKLTDLLAWGNDVDIIEYDKSGHPQQQWLHAHDGHVLPVSISLHACIPDAHSI